MSFLIQLAAPAATSSFVLFLLFLHILHEKDTWGWFCRFLFLSYFAYYAGKLKEYLLYIFCGRFFFYYQLCWNAECTLVLFAFRMKSYADSLGFYFDFCGIRLGNFSEPISCYVNMSALCCLLEGGGFIQCYLK